MLFSLWLVSRFGVSNSREILSGVLTWRPGVGFCVEPGSRDESLGAQLVALENSVRLRLLSCGETQLTTGTRRIVDRAYLADPSSAFQDIHQGLLWIVRVFLQDAGLRLLIPGDFFRSGFYWRSGSSSSCPLCAQCARAVCELPLPEDRSYRVVAGSPGGN